MRVLLLYPEFPDTFWSFKHALWFLRKRSAAPPLGLLTVAALLPAEWEKQLVDLNVTKLSDEALGWADIVFMSAMIVQRDSVASIIERCRTAGVTLVAGGPLFTMEPEQYSDVDHLVLNEAELTLPRFLADWENGCPQRLYATREHADITQSPVPLWSLVDLKRYSILSIQYSRGCPYDCEFCNVTSLLGHRPRIKTSVQLLAELDELYRLGWRGGVFFVDDNFIGNKRQLKRELLPALIEWRKGKRGMLFNTEASLDLADDPQLMRLMTSAGFTTVFVGIETPHPESLAECNKAQNKNRNLLQSVKELHRAGLEVQGGFIVGFDSDPPEIFQQQVDFIQRSGIVTAMVGLLQAPRGTRLFERMKREKRLVESWTGNNGDGSTNIIPKMGLQTLQNGYYSILRQIYAPASFYRRVRAFLREYQPPGARIHIDLQHILAIGRSMLRLGILEKERSHYWKLMVWTLLRRTRLFPQALTEAIYGYHFRVTTARYSESTLKRTDSRLPA